jgi:hypothetical protein
MKTLFIVPLRRTSFFLIVLFLFPLPDLKAQVNVILYGDSVRCATVVNPRENQTPVTFSNLTPNTLSCFWDFGDTHAGGKDTLTGNPSNYTTTSVNYEYFTAGTYTVTLTVSTSNGTGSAKHVIKVNPTPHSAFTTALITGTSFEFTSISTGSVSNYSWFFGDTLDYWGGHTTLNPVGHTYAKAGNYQVALIVQNSFGCADTSYNNLIFTGINELTSNSNFRIYPNPSSDGLYFLEAKDMAEATLTYEVSNSEGQIICRQESKEKNIRIDLSAEAKGLYFLVLHQGNKVYQHKLLLVR